MIRSVVQVFFTYLFIIHCAKLPAQYFE
jgi:hypothetical protein